ncbi:hypothetical protein CYLTODRAFT_346938 [Cylindrobasidium torrendii FP15055 ss-10]|uniref:Peptide N-acetyl-beta-D-glucosaminyl asparaginase amidase A N-terminal domain-containing protein n=1 Tax=Cylindrobasidium torrendii FP15055 ss-10 TaxID=1314674 RepID=A0A0D7BL26_9AGAR|nr:hypothetical protein CYLTODRAFT_346938 [Cylindrobasidium torrendii FP15055 ss-10]
MRLSAFALTAALVRTASSAVLENFQVTQPAILPSGVKQCTVEVLRRDFASSYGHAEVVELIPPTDCGPLGSWSAITLNLTVTSNGTQYDRLGVFTFQNVEIWRTSTPEPTRGDGIRWTYVKDVTKYLPLFEKPGTFIFQLDNIIQEGLDGVYSTVVGATYYASSEKHPTAAKADLIIPLSTLANDTGNDAAVPPGFSLNVTLPTNTIKVFAELYASGNSQEEFWYLNAPNDYLEELPDGTTYGQGPFREVRLLVDGRLSGVAFPYAVLFTGGIIPSFWRPIAAYGALDLPTYFIDVTPFASLLADGNPHNFTIDVASAENDHAILGNWFVSGALYVVLDTSPKPTTGGITVYEADPYASSSVSRTDTGDVAFTVSAERTIHIEATVISGSGETTTVVWTQNLSYENKQTFDANATVQTMRQTASGTTKSTHNGKSALSDVFEYPLDIDFTYENENLTSWTSSLNHTYDRALLPSPLQIENKIHNEQGVVGFFEIRTGGNLGNGTSNNSFTYGDVLGNTYSRTVNAALNNITFDEESGSLAGDIDKELQADRMAGGGDEGIQARLPGRGEVS